MLGYFSGFGRKRNALLTLLLSGYLFVNGVNILLDGDFTWSVYALSVVLLVFIPALVLRDRTAVPPFEVLFYLAIPFTLKGMELGFAASYTLNYLTAAGIALLMVTELDTYTSFSTTPRFSVWIVSITTVAMSGFWAAGRWLSHVHFGTAFEVAEETLMWEFAAAALAGVIAGAVFTYYFRRRDRRLKTDED